MRFLTWANDPADPRCELMFASARHFGIEVEPIGVGKEYRGGVSKIEWLADKLSTLNPDEFVLCTDAHDCLYVGEYVDDSAPGIFCFAGQRWYRHQCDNFKWMYDEVDCRSVYRYPDAGIISGMVGDLLPFYKTMLAESRLRPDVKWEQWFVSRAVATSEACILDYHAECFYCCGGEWRRFAGEVVDGRFRNKRTGMYPYILHAPIPRRSQAIRERVAKELGII